MRRSVKKLVASAAILGSFIIYSIIHSRSSTVSPVAFVRSTGISTATAVDTPLVSGSATPGASTATATPTTHYRDGSYSGSVADAQWGYVQVQAVVQGGRLTDVKFLEYPNERQRSVEINAYADPILTNEALQAQSANVDFVSGATDTSVAFVQSLTNALNQAKG